LRKSAGHFRVGAADGARHHHDIGFVQVFGAVADENRCAEACQPLRDRIGLEIGALHFIAQIEQHFGDAAHAAAADTHHVNALNSAHAIVHAPAFSDRSAPAHA